MNKIEKIAERLKEHPELVERFESILDVVDNTYGDMELADDVEERVIEEMKQLGHETLTDWAKKQSIQKAEKFSQAGKGRKDSKKK